MPREAEPSLLSLLYCHPERSEGSGFLRGRPKPRFLVVSLLGMTGGWVCPLSEWQFCPRAEPSFARPGRVEDPSPHKQMSNTAKVAMVAALEREVHQLVKHWRRVDREYEGRRFKFFESGESVLVCGGIGAEAARRATEAVIALYQPELVQSVGFAGALDPTLKLGEIFSPSRVIDVRDGSSVEMATGCGALVSAATVASAEQKLKLAESYGARAVDMEAAAVGRGAQARGVRFMAVKAISDESNFAMPAMDRFVGEKGQFRTGRFVTFAAVRPWLWTRVIQLARNGAKASRALCVELDRYIHEAKKTEVSGPELHQISKVIS
jgi:adenosylhomocysteine nucleosidase